MPYRIDVNGIPVYCSDVADVFALTGALSTGEPALCQLAQQIPIQQVASGSVTYRDGQIVETETVRQSPENHPKSDRPSVSADSVDTTGTEEG